MLPQLLHELPLVPVLGSCLCLPGKLLYFSIFLSSDILQVPYLFVVVVFLLLPKSPQLVCFPLQLPATLSKRIHFLLQLLLDCLHHFQLLCLFNDGFLVFLLELTDIQVFGWSVGFQLVDQLLLLLVLFLSYLDLLFAHLQVVVQFLYSPLQLLNFLDVTLHLQPHTTVNFYCTILNWLPARVKLWFRKFFRFRVPFRSWTFLWPVILLLFWRFPRFVFFSARHSAIRDALVGPLLSGLPL